MARRTKTDGRRAGALNRRTQEVEDRLRELCCDPIAGLAQIAMDVGNSVELRQRACAELMPYLAPRRKAIDHHLDLDDGKLQINVINYSTLAAAAVPEQRRATVRLLPVTRDPAA